MEKLINWSIKNFDDIPWRRKRSLYRTLVSEVMLQQTTVATVLNHFERFILQYPDLKTLAAATEEEICIAWKGLGYYRRACNLLKAAQFIQSECGGRIPGEYEKLIQIPGIGDYTASAIMAMGKDRKALCIDANIERVTSRLYGIKMAKGPKLSSEIRQRWQRGEIYSNSKHFSYRKFNEALMDLGRVICQAKKVDCNLCPLSGPCVAHKQDPLAYPAPSKSVSRFFDLDLIRYVVTKGNRILVYQKPKGSWLSGQYELPTFTLKSQDRSFKQYPSWQGKKIPPLVTLKSSITKYKIANHVVEVSEDVARRDFRGHGKLLYKNLAPEQNFSHTTFKILKKIKPSKE